MTLTRRQPADIVRINPHYQPERPLAERFEPAYSLQDHSDRETRDAMPSFLYRDPPPREPDAKAVHPVLAWARFGFFVCAALVIIPMQASMTTFQIWRGK